jgi:DNA ligase-1
MMTEHGLMHGRNWKGGTITGWIGQQKFDGWRALWTGERLISRQGVEFCAPDWFLKGLPVTPLDCELYLGPGRVGQISAMAWDAGSRLWREATLMTFDAPHAPGGYMARINSIAHHCEFAHVPSTFVVDERIRDRLAELKADGGEGFMVRDTQAGYRHGRSYHLLKVK